MINKCYNNTNILSVDDNLLLLNDLVDKELQKQEKLEGFNLPLKNTSMQEVYKWFKENNIILPDIPYISYIEIDKIINTDDYMQVLIDKLKYLPPFNIPVVYINSNDNYGQFTPLYIGKTLEESQLIFCEYILASNTYQLPLIYTHEIIHSVIENFNNLELFINYDLIPMSYEKIIAFEFDENLFYDNQIFRLKTIKKCISILNEKKHDELEFIYASNYLLSTLLSDSIFDIYSISKKNIKGDLKKIIEGEKEVEYILNKYDLNYDESLKNKIMKMKG